MIRHMTYSRFIAGAICLTLIALVSIGRAQSPALQPRSDARFVYVSPERGDDANPGLHDAPVKTAERGLSLLRNGYGDWLLLERGYEYRLENRVMLPRGASADTPVVIAAFGSGDTPQLHVGPNRDAFNYQNLLADYITVAPTVQLTGLADPFPILQPGNGWSGPTPQPDPVGKPGDLGYDAKAIARWDVVPYQTFDGDFHIGVVAFHMNGIDRVEFAVDGGPWTPVHEMQLNPRTNVWEYTVTLRASLFKKDGPIEVRAIAWPKGAGEPRVLESLELFTETGTSKTKTIFVALSGKDTNDGTHQKPFATLNKAIDVVTDGGTIVLMEPGVYEAPDRPYGHQQKKNTRWITITTDGLARDQVTISRTTRGSARPNVSRLKWHGVTFDFAKITQHYAIERFTWFDNVIWTDSPEQFLQWPEGTHKPYTRGLVYVTDSIATNVMFGFADTELARNIHIERLYGDVFFQSRVIVNATVQNVIAEAHSHHTDVIQMFGNRDNNIYYGITVDQIKGGQGFFLEPTFREDWADDSMKNCAFVNVSIIHIPWANNTGGAPYSQLLGKFSHVLFYNVKLPYQRLLLRSTASDYQNFQVVGAPIVFRDCELWYGTYDNLRNPRQGVITDNLIRGPQQ